MEAEREGFDKKLAETLRTSIDAYSMQDKIRVEDLISKVKA